MTSDYIHTAAPATTLFSDKRYACFLAWGLGLVFTLGIVAPRSLAFLPGVFGLLAYLTHWYLYKTRLVLNKSYLAIAAGICGLGIISTLWAIDPEEAFARSYKTALILFPGVLLFSALRHSPLILRDYLIKIFPWLTLGAIALFLFEFITEGILQSLAKSTPLEEINMSSYNRGMVFLTFMLFPILALFILEKSQARKNDFVFLIMGIIGAIYIYAATDSQSAQLALIAGLIIFIVHKFFSTWIWKIMALSIITLLFAAPFLAIWMFNTLPDIVGGNGWLKQAYAMHRMEIWDFVSRYALQNPLYGYGMEATKAVEDFDTQMLYFRNPVVLHPHNFALQIWIEFGVIGIVAASALIFFILNKIHYLPQSASRVFLSLFFAILCVASTGYGLWQGWFVGAVTLSLAFCTVFSHTQSREL